MGGRLVVDFLIDTGLKPNDKIKSQVTIPDWIKENDSYLRSCIRGLIDTDGCVYEMLPHWPGLFQLNFENRNITLLRDTREALIKLGYHPSKICGKRTINGTKFYISRKEEIKRFYKEIGSSNDRNIKQFNKVLNS
ncbi:LAGLIDADG family homing endonuclease [Candidatus Woesearchaeota archaeon]|nr:LAGLIDADG family homing endonuclease [Candidatus Woesearchaeota archaeon]